MKTDDFKKSMFENIRHCLEEGNCEDALDALNRLEVCDKNIGLSTNRLNYDKQDLENAFHKAWIEENLPQRGLNNGNGILQDLMITHDITVSNRERAIVASIIQWLGTNVGRSFLERALARCDLKIVKKDK